MSESFQLRRTGWDVAIGALLAIAGLVVIGHAAIATTVSVLFIGWTLIIAGVLGLVAALFRIGKGGFWSAALGGGLLAALGLVIVNNTEATALTLTLIAGTLFLVSGVVRLMASAQDVEYRVPLIFGGVVSTVLGLIVLFNLFDVSFVLLGVLIGVQLLVDGITVMLIGRWHVATTGAVGGLAPR